MAMTFPKKLKAVRTGEPANDSRTNEMMKELTEFTQQFIVKEDDHQHIDWQAIEDAMGLEHGTLYRLHNESEDKGSRSISLIMGVLFGMWAMDTRYHHLETKPLCVTE